MWATCTAGATWKCGWCGLNIWGKIGDEDEDEGGDDDDDDDDDMMGMY